MKKILLILTIALLVSGCMDMLYSISDEVKAEQTTTEYIVPQDGAVIIVENINGNVDFSRSVSNKIEIGIRKTTPKDEAELKKAKVVIDDNQGNIVIKTEYLEKNVKVSVHYSIKLPENAYLGSVDLVNGSLKIADIKVKDAVFECVNGNITITKVRGAVSAESVNGNITVKDTPVINSLESMNGSISAEIIDVSNRIEIETMNGNIKLYISDKENILLTAETTNGSVNNTNSSLNVDKIKKTKLKGSLGNAKYDLEVATMNGSITLNDLN
ncbi:MAG: DUF4097 family beta strand repeat protein [Candidatus Delongbacteria bacterium]|nr:DUF4097 family beta strand repeat protein [Candidatus Delongbacteria bacterium]